MEHARKWGNLTVSNFGMDEHGMITAHFSESRGSDRLEMTLTVSSQNYENVSVPIVATAPCLYPSHSFSKHSSDGNATCRADGTKSAVCDGCHVTDVLPDVESRLPPRL